MSTGPMQWSQAHGRMVPAVGYLPPPDEVLEEEQSEFEQALAQKPRLAPASKVPVSGKPMPSAPINVLKLAKARLKEVLKGLRAAKALDKERIELERLIEAASGPPKATGRVVGHIAPSKTSAK